MSYIYGIANLNKEEIDGKLVKELPLKIQKYNYKLDDFSQKEFKAGLFGCGLQIFTKDAKLEKLPLIDENSGLAFTADCVIDNRKDLLTILNLDDTNADGYIMYAALKQMGMAALSQFRGVFSFAYYERQENKLILAVDQFASRCLYYSIEGQSIYFSTTLFPLLKDMGLEREQNEDWLIKSVSLRSPAMSTEPASTPFTKIYKIVAGTYLEFSLDEGKVAVKEVRYYDPVKNNKVNCKIDKNQGGRLMQQTLREATAVCLHTEGKIATQLSSGLDSSTIACLAAGELEKKGEELYSYTSVPLKEAGLKNKGAALYDETDGVLEIVKAYPNIKPTFVDSKGRSFIRETTDVLKTWEYPCKSQQNAIWIDEIYKEAAENGCKILLNGATGNCTCSAGSIEVTSSYYFRRLRFYKAYKTFDAVKNIGVSRKKYFKIIMGGIKDYYAYNFKPEMKDAYKYIATRKDIGEKHKLSKFLRKKVYHVYPIYSFKRFRSLIYPPEAYAQIGDIDTKYSLKYGVLPRDPMRNVEVINLCLTLPIECFASDDYDRRLIRIGMAGVVPEKIRLDVLHRGHQSGDNFYRLSLDWDEMLPEIKNTLYSEKTLHYLDRNILDGYFKELTAENLGEKYMDSLIISDLYSFGKYLELTGDMLF